MKWGGGFARNSPSLDKIIPSKGYRDGLIGVIAVMAFAILATYIEQVYF